MTRRIALLALTLAACSRTQVDPNATGIEIATQIDPADGITQLRISGTANGSDAFAPGALPDKPRALSGTQTAVILLPDSLDGTDVLVRVDALAADRVVHTGGGTVTVHAGDVRHLDVQLGVPAICGDGMIESPFETCDDANTAIGDGCTAECTVETGWTCVGMPSQCDPLSSHKEITSYAFLAVANPGLAHDVIATINGTTISATVPFGTNVGALVATFAMTGTSARVSGQTQVSGATPNDFASPIDYLVVADDGSTKSYTVSVTVAPGTAKDIMSYAFRAAENPGLASDIDATINGTTIAATVPAGTDVHALVATFNTTGVSVAVGATPQISTVTANDFTSPVTYTVTAADTSTKTYTVTVTVATSTSKELTAFSFASANNPTLPMDVTATINGTSIAATVPSGTDVGSLVATFSTTGAKVTVGQMLQTSGVTPNDFSSPVTYTVAAADLSTQTYTVTVTVAASSAKDLTSFAFLSANNAGLPADVIATISGTTITATVPAGTDVTALVASFTTSGASVAVGGAMQTSGVTANNFTAPVSYVVTAADGSTKSYTVTVTPAASSAKDITSYVFRSATNPTLSADVVATINGTSITATVPSGTNVHALIATFATTGVSVAVGQTVQTSGVTPNNFMSPVTYTVTAGDGSTKSYQVTVTVASSAAKDLTAFSFLSATNSGLPADALGTINGTTITVTVPTGTDVTALVATFTTTGMRVKVGTKTQTSGQTANDFTSPVTYTVVASDNSTKQYTVTVGFM